MNTGVSNSICDVIAQWADKQPDHLAFTDLDNFGNATGSLTYGEFYNKVAALGSCLKQRCDAGKNAVLMYHRGLDFIISFMACQYAGVVPIPVHVPKKKGSNKKLIEIINSSTAPVVLTDSRTIANLDKINDYREWPRKTHYEATDELLYQATGIAEPYKTSSNSPHAFIQYTSGSTSQPKGVMITHKNCLYNLEMIRLASGGNPNSVYVCWLPHFHDLGLVAHYLAALYCGGHNVLLSPSSVVQNPSVWLKAITEYGGTITGAPNFAYQLCVDKVHNSNLVHLDLSTLDLVINAAEPIKPNTIRSFINKFSTCGFKSHAFLPAYGMAEATVFISCGEKTQEPIFKKIDRHQFSVHGIAKVVDGNRTENTQEFVGCGKSWLEEEIKIVDPDTGLEKMPNSVGEIWVSGDHVMNGYFNNPEATSETLALLHGCSTKYLRTGDLGFIDENGELFVTGRVKDLIIINGANYYPQDIEHAMEEASKFVRKGCLAAFSVGNNSSEEVIVAVEVTSQALKEIKSNAKIFTQMAGVLCEAVGTKLDINLKKIIFLKPGQIDKTSSGKIKRQACKQMYLDGYEGNLSVWPDKSTNNIANESHIMKNIQQILSAVNELGGEHLKVFSTLMQILSEKHNIHLGDFDLDQSIFFYGIDSINIVDIHAEMEKRLGATIKSDAFFEANNFLDMIDAIVKCMDNNECTTRERSLRKDIETRFEVLKAEFEKAQATLPHADRSGNVLLTGASGYVGIYLLKEILDSTDFTVHCVVRAANETLGWDRIVRNAARYQISFPASQAERVKITIADISKERMGLSRDKYEEIANKVDSIYHCAAIDNFYLPYSVLKKTNVYGTVEMVKFATVGKIKPLYYVSSCAASLLENRDDKIQTIGLINGYAQTKYVSEKIIMRLIDRGFPAINYRFGYLYSLEADMADENESFETFLSSIYEMGRMPDIDIVFDLTPVEYAAKSILKTSVTQESQRKTNYIFYNPSPLKWSDIKEYFKEIHRDMEVVPIAEFTKCFQDHVRSSNRKSVKLLKSVVSEDVQKQINTMFKNVKCDDVGLIQDWCPPCDGKFARHYVDIAFDWKGKSVAHKTVQAKEEEAILE